MPLKPKRRLNVTAQDTVLEVTADA
jgi:hypothetical protein